MMDDWELVDLYLKGDRSAFNALVRRYEKPIYNYILKMVRNREDAADLTQDVFVRCYGRLESLRDKEKFTPWLYRIAINRVRDHWRKRGNHEVEWPTTGNPHSSLDTPDRVVESEYRKELVRKALGIIPSEQREVLVLKAYQGCKFREIAEIVGVPLSTVKSRLYYGLSNMRKLFKEWNLGDLKNHEM